MIQEKIEYPRLSGILLSLGPFALFFIAMSIRTKIIGSFFSVLVLFGAVSSYTYIQSRQINRQLSMLSELFLPLSRQMLQIQVGTQNLAEEIHHYYSDGEPASDRSTFSRMARDLYPYAIQKKFMIAEQLLISFEGTSNKSIVQMTLLLTELKENFDALINAKQKAQFDAQFIIFKKKLQGFSKKIDDECEKTTTAAKAIGQESHLTTVGLSFLLLFLGLFCLVISYQVLNPLPHLIQSLKKLTGGDFDQNIKVKTSEKDEISQLAREFNRMLGALKDRDHKIKGQQKELLQSAKLAAIGQLSAEVVHEIRNPLNSINLNIDWLASEIKDSNPEIKKTIESISREIERLAQITESYLVRARVKEKTGKTTEVNELLQELIHFERGETRNVVIETEFEPGEIYIQSDRSRIKQAFINILKNAKEAMPQGGKIRVKTVVTEEHMQVVFSDSGMGMTAETKAKTFTPFFTTKPNGTGLGLALTKEIIEAAKGRILVSSELGIGTTFTCQFSR